MSAMKISVDLLHCHDYHTGLIPFMVKHCPEFKHLQNVKTIETIHNGEYQCIMSWEMLDFFPKIESSSVLGLLDWDGAINPLAAMIKCSHKLSTVSQEYMDELRHDFRGLESPCETRR